MEDFRVFELQYLVILWNFTEGYYQTRCKIIRYVQFESLIRRVSSLRCAALHYVLISVRDL